MDCFYAAIEVRERPELTGRPVAVGGRSGRGVLTTCNYEARKFGCASAMPTFKALQLCPDLTLLSPRFSLYRRESERMRKILLSYTPLVEPLSLDEAYLDVSLLDRYGWEVAKEIRRKIHENTDLTASAGIAPNKLLAKIASDWRKPNGQFAVTPDEVSSFMKVLPASKIWGIGPKSTARLREMGINSCGQLQKLSLSEMFRYFGKFGEELYNLCRGRDDRAVEPHRLRKSMSNERTFEDDLGDMGECVEALQSLYSELLEDLEKKAADRTVVKAFVKVKFADFRQTTKECLCKKPSFGIFRELLRVAYLRSDQKVRLLGAGVRFREERKEERRQLELSFE